MFIDIYIGMSRSVNYLHVLRRFVLYMQVQLHGLFDITSGSCEDLPYLLNSTRDIPLLARS